MTEHFVDTQGKPIPPPPGFRQGKQTLIERDPYTFKQKDLLLVAMKLTQKRINFKDGIKENET